MRMKKRKIGRGRRRGRRRRRTARRCTQKRPM